MDPDHRLLPSSGNYPGAADCRYPGRLAGSPMGFDPGNEAKCPSQTASEMRLSAAETKCNNFFYLACQGKQIKLFHPVCQSPGGDSFSELNFDTDKLAESQSV